MNSKRAQLAVEISHDLRRQLKVVAAQRGVSVRDLLIPAIRRIVAEEHEVTRDSDHGRK